MSMLCFKAVWRSSGWLRGWSLWDDPHRPVLWPLTSLLRDRHTRYPDDRWVMNSDCRFCTVHVVVRHWWHCGYWIFLQASIELTDEGEFIIHNEGRRPLFISGKAVTSGQSSKLAHNQTLEVSTCSDTSLLFKPKALICSLSLSSFSSLSLSSLPFRQIASMSFLVLLNSKLASTVGTT